ncbi:MAG: methionine--tRNA ligase [Pseudomonadota bacterium]
MSASKSVSKTVAADAANGEPRTILVTSALPYANGSIHLGHLVEYIQTDIWVRFMKLKGHTVHYVCADDTHGTPIMLRAEKEGISPEALIARVHTEHKNDFEGFGIEFDHYGSTHSELTREWAYTVYRRLKEKGFIVSRFIEQYFDPVKNMFLPDRFIKGECPRCAAQDQYGDSCEVCGAVYSPRDLKNPRSVVSGSVPEIRESEHYFFKLDTCTGVLEEWLNKPGRVPDESRHKLQEWFENGLQDWDISRDAPYFGFEIPDHPGKYFYVWLDAPIGYMGSFHELCRQKNIDFNAYWGADSKTDLVHFIGKDILYFHALFWPAMLDSADFRMPTQLFVHGFLTVNGEKMSKSRGTFITAKSYLDQKLDDEWLRFYYASKINASVEDIDLNFEDFTAKVNSILIGKLVNIPSRVAGFIHKRFEGKLSKLSLESEALQVLRFNVNMEPALALGYAEISQAEKGTCSVLDVIAELMPSIAIHFEKRDFAKAVRLIEQGLDIINQYVDTTAPWILAKSEGSNAYLHEVCTVTLDAFRRLLIPLSAILPKLVQKAETFLNIAPQHWVHINEVLPEGHSISAYSHLMQRVDPKEIQQLIALNAETLSASTASLSASNATQSETSNKLTNAQPVSSDTLANIDNILVETPISIDQFSAVDLRVVRIISAEEIPAANKLLKITVSLGGDNTRTVFAGIKSAYSPEQLLGKLTVMVANLAPRKMKFGVSEGMLLAASDEGGHTSGLFLLSPDSGAQPGMKIK